MRSVETEDHACRRAESPRSAGGRVVLGIAALVCCCVTAGWWGALDAGFAFDDIIRIVHREESLATPWPTWDLVRTSQRPLVELTLWANYAIGGLAPRGYHVFNLIVHALAATALALVVLEALACLRAREGSVGQSGRDRWIAVSVALLWGLHPLQASAATYVIQRAESLAALWTLLAALSLLRGRTVSVVLCVVAAILSKPTAVSAPFVILALDVCVVAGNMRSALRARWKMHAADMAALSLLVALGVIGGLLGAEDGRIAGYGAGVAGVGPIDHAWRALHALGLYVALPFAPGFLAIDRGTAALLQTEWLVLGIAAIAALLALLVRGRSAWWIVLPIEFCVLLAPTTSVVPLADAAADHRMYLPSALIAIAVVALGARFAAGSGGRRLVAIAALALAVVLELAGTAARNRAFADPIVLWTEVIEDDPTHARALRNRAGLLLEAGRDDEAAADLARARTIEPGSPALLVNEALLAIRLGDPQGALDKLVIAMQSRRTDSAVLAARGDALRALGRADEAIKFYALASRRAPGAAIYPALEGNALADLGRDDASIEAFARALARCDDAAMRASIQFNIGNAHLRRGRRADAARAYREALDADPAHAGAARWLKEVANRASE